MPAFTSSAPGKVILFGEHAVVYGRPAIAAPVLQVSARAILRPEPRSPAGRIQIQAPELELKADWEELAVDHPLRAVLSAVLDTLGISQPPACTVRITSTIPVAAGLGSGAAVSVAVIRAFSAFLGHPLPDNQVSALAFEIEKLHHGTPSGIDNTVITYRKPIYFTRGQPIETLIIPKPFTILIGDTGIKSPTAIAVGDLRRAWEREPDRFEALFDQIGGIARSARRSLESGKIDLVGPLMDQNQVLLEELGVSSPEIETLVRAAREAGAQGAKLSGGGRGGNMIALTDQAAAPEISQALQAAGAKQVVVTEI